MIGVPAAFDTRTTVGEINLYAAHHICPAPEQIRAIMPSYRLPVDQPQICFVDQRGSLKHVDFALTVHITAGEPVQFGVHERRETFDRELVAVAPSRQ